MDSFVAPVEKLNAAFSDTITGSPLAAVASGNANRIGLVDDALLQVLLPELMVQTLIVNSFDATAALSCMLVGISSADNAEFVSIDAMTVVGQVAWLITPEPTVTHSPVVPPVSGVEFIANVVAGIAY